MMKHFKTKYIFSRNEKLLWFSS